MPSFTVIAVFQKMKKGFLRNIFRHLLMIQFKIAVVIYFIVLFIKIHMYLWNLLLWLTVWAVMMCGLFKKIWFSIVPNTLPVSTWQIILKSSIIGWEVDNYFIHLFSWRKSVWGGRMMIVWQEKFWAKHNGYFDLSVAINPNNDTCSQ